MIGNLMTRQFDHHDVQMMVSDGLFEEITGTRPEGSSPLISLDTMIWVSHSDLELAIEGALRLMAERQDKYPLETEVAAYRRRGRPLTAGDRSTKIWFDYTNKSTGKTWKLIGHLLEISEPDGLELFNVGSQRRIEQRYPITRLIICRVGDD